MQTTLDTAAGPMPLFTATPDTARRGAIVVIQEAFGVTPHIQSIAELLAAHGWLAVSPTLYHRTEPQVFSYDDLPAVMPAMQTLTSDGIVADLDATFAHLAVQGIEAGQTGIVGFCMGGTVALHAAATRVLGAAVTFYGGGLGAPRFGFPPGLDLATHLQTPWLGLYGDRDPGIPVDDVERLRQVVAEASVDAEVVRYAEGQHGFNCDDRPSVFDADLAADARQRMLDWFERHIV
ncbi:MAG: dienelactone hydrolase family protein [Ilumatobacteraceae bacterium]